MQRNNEFGTLLTNIRLSAGYSQREVAEQMHISRSAYGHLESCIRKPTAEFIIRIAELYQTNPLIFLQALIPEEIHANNKQFVKYISDLCDSPKTLPRRKQKRKNALKSKR